MTGGGFMMKRISGCTGVMLAALVLVACSGGKESQPAARSASDAGTASGTVAFKYWGSEQQSVMEAIANGFNAKNPAIKATAIYEPSDQYWTKLIASIAAGNPTADVAWINPTYAAQMMSNNQLASVSELYDSGKVDKSKFTAAAIGSYTWTDGQIYAVPKDFQTVCLIYNKGIFDEVGIPYPTDDWTWDDLLNACQAIVKTDAQGQITRYGYVHNYSVMSSWFVYCYANGGDLFNPEGNSGNYCNTPQNVEAFQWAQDMVFKYKVSPPADVTSEINVDNLFINEMVAMTAYVPAQLENYTQALGDKVAVAQFPYKTKKATITNCLGYAIAVGTKNLAAAKEFMVYLGSREGQEPQAQLIIPAYQGIVSSMEEKFNDMNFRAYIDSGVFAVPTPVERHVGNAARVALETQINYIMFGEKNAPQALADAEEEIRKLVATAEAERK
jgi:multiple sugar transport system substrate-binding protein